jgi:hypothetical protein
MAYPYHQNNSILHLCERISSKMKRCNFVVVVVFNCSAKFSKVAQLI